MQTEKEETKELRAKPPERKYPEELLDRYSAKYPHNPEGALEFHTSKKMKEGKTREQAIQELLEESE